MRNSKGRLSAESKLHPDDSINAFFLEKWLVKQVNIESEKHDKATDLQETIRRGSKLTALNQILNFIRTHKQS